MATEDRELGPFKPAPDMLILAAIERAICHGASDVWMASNCQLRYGRSRTR